MACGCEVACYHPVAAYRTVSGDVVFCDRGNVKGSLLLPCGRCIGCRIEYARQWTVRIMHEASLWQENSFVTLTYSDAHLPSHGSLVYSHFQKFIRALRKRFPGRVIRFYMCGEYGDEKRRPHFHAAIFNCAFLEDRYVWRDFGSGHVVYRSATLESVWRYGDSCIGELTSESANYVARYVMKKVYGDRADLHYRVVDTTTGECVWLEPEFTRMSLKPGIGAKWFEKFSSDVFPHDRVVVKGRVSRPPRYYDKLLRRKDAVASEGIKAKRMKSARERYLDNTRSRRRVKEKVATARLSTLRRKLK